MNGLSRPMSPNKQPRETKPGHCPPYPREMEIVTSWESPDLTQIWQPGTNDTTTGNNFKAEAFPAPIMYRRFREPVEKETGVNKMMVRKVKCR